MKITNSIADLPCRICLFSDNVVLFCFLFHLFGSDQFEICVKQIVFRLSANRLHGIFVCFRSLRAVNRTIYHKIQVVNRLKRWAQSDLYALFCFLITEIGVYVFCTKWSAWAHNWPKKSIYQQLKRGKVIRRNGSNKTSGANRNFEFINEFCFYFWKLSRFFCVFLCVCVGVFICEYV